MALITPAQVREHLPQATGTGDDTILATLVDRVDGLMAIFCGWPANDLSTYTLQSSTYTLYPMPDSDRVRALDHGLRWVGTITSAHVDEAWDYAAASAVASGDMVIDNREGVLWLRPDSGSAWSTSDRANKVVLTCGFSTAPEWLVVVAASAVRHLLMKRRMGEVQSQSGSGGTVTPQDQDDLLPKAVRASLSPLIHWRSRLG